jgi:hypothetical protein
MAESGYPSRFHRDAEQVSSIETRAASGSHDRGATFIEVLVSVVLLGTVGVAVLVATSAAIVGARTSDEVAKSQASIAEAADYLTDTDPENVAYRACDSLSPADLMDAYQADLDTRFSSGVVEIVEIRYWDRPSGTFSGTCGSGSGYRLQQIEIRSVINGAPRTVSIVKRPAAIPTADVVAAPAAPPYAAGSGQVVVSLTPGINGP